MRMLIGNRTNDDWLTELRQSSTETAALEDLRSYLRSALARILRARAHIDESDLDDFTQDALVRIMENLDRFRGDSRFTTWATAVAVRVALGTLRQRRYHELSLSDVDFGVAEPAAASSGVEPLLEREPLYGALRRAIREDLTQRQRTVVLGELAGVPSTVLVEQLGTNPNALYKLHHDARKKLRRSLARAGFDDDDVRRELELASDGA